MFRYLIRVSYRVFRSNSLGSQVANFMGKGGLRAVSNVFNLLLAAITITMVIRGLGLLGIINMDI